MDHNAALKHIKPPSVLPVGGPTDRRTPFRTRPGTISCKVSSVHPRRTDGRSHRHGDLDRPTWTFSPAARAAPGTAAACLTLLSVRNVEYGGSGADMVVVGRPCWCSGSGGSGAPVSPSLLCGIFAAFRCCCLLLHVLLVVASRARAVHAPRPGRELRGACERRRTVAVFLGRVLGRHV